MAEEVGLVRVGSEFRADAQLLTAFHDFIAEWTGTRMAILPDVSEPGGALVLPARPGRLLLHLGGPLAHRRPLLLAQTRHVNSVFRDARNLEHPLPDEAVRRPRGPSSASDPMSSLKARALGAAPSSCVHDAGRLLDCAWWLGD